MKCFARRLALAAVAAAALFGARPAHALTTVCNTAYVDFQNEATTPQAQVSSTPSCFSAESDPVLSLSKITSTFSLTSGAAGATVYFDILVAYPRIADTALGCGDDSQALNVTVSDPVPASFNYLPGTIQVSSNDGTSWTALTDVVGGPDDAGEHTGGASGTVTVRLGTLNEGFGDPVCAGVATRRRVRFALWKN